MGIVVEVELQADDRNRYSWPVYVAGLRARIRCPVCLLVVTAHDAVARWAAQAIDLGGGNRFGVPLAVGGWLGWSLRFIGWRLRRRYRSSRCLSRRMFEACRVCVGVACFIG